MLLIKELVKVITRVKLRAIRKIGFPFETDNRLSEMYEMVANDTAEEKIANDLIGTSHRSGAFRRLKVDLTGRLIASLFLVDLSLPSYNDRQVAYYEVHKNWAAAKILLGKGARLAAIHLAEQTFRQARKFEFNDIALDIAKALRLQFATVLGDAAKYHYYNAATEELEQCVYAESLAEGLYAKFILVYVRKHTASQEVVEVAKESCERLQPYLENVVSSYTLHLYYHLMQMNRYTAVPDYEAAIYVCDKMIDFFEHKPYTANIPLQLAYYQKLVCYFQLRKFELTVDFVERGLSIIEEGTYNWFKFQETYLLLSLHTAQYEMAYRIFMRVEQHPRFAYQPADVQEYWRILEAYLHYLAVLELLPPTADETFSRFRIGRFLNQTPLFSRDKRGVNVTILIIQILFYIARKDFFEAYTKIGTIEQYCRRHLFGKDTLRAYYFIKALLELPKNAFHREAVKRKATRYLDKMADYPLEEAGMSSFLIEVIPFEALWQQILGSLEHKFYKK
ncbi:MAG: hypothetical protein R2795_05660 [Saprospiraceae bacterium]